MSDFTFLTEEQCYGNDKLDILKKRGATATMTDFSILLGGWMPIDTSDWPSDCTFNLMKILEYIGLKRRVTLM